MKKIKAIFGLLFVALMFASCEQEEGALYKESSTNTLSFASDKYVSKWTPSDGEEAISTTSIQVELRRGSSEGTLDVPITLAAPNSSFQLASESVHFAAGETRTLVTVNFPAVKEWVAGTTHNLSVAIDSTSLSVSGYAKVNISLAYDYAWVSAGWVSMTSTWADTTAGVNVEHAGGSNLYRLVSPYYVLEPAYAAPGYHLYFTLDDNYNALEFYELQEIGEATGGSPIMMYGFGGNSFTNTANKFTLIAHFVYVASGQYNGWANLDESFVWEEGYPGM